MPSVGGFTISSPVAVLSSLRSRFAAARAANCLGLPVAPGHQEFGERAVEVEGELVLS